MCEVKENSFFFKFQECFSEGVCWAVTSAQRWCQPRSAGLLPGWPPGQLVHALRGQPPLDVVVT